MKKLSTLQKMGFGVADLGGNMFFTAMGFWSLVFLTDEALLSASLAGLVVMLAKFWDAVTDPIVGFMSDKTCSRFGRRRPYLLFFAVPFGLCVWLFYTNFKIQNQTALFAYSLFTLCLLNTAMTLVNIPYSALTPELTDDYDERSSLNAYRFVFGGLGTFCGAILVSSILSKFADQTKGFSVAGLVMGSIIAVSTLITFFSVKEPPLTEEKKKVEDKKSFKDTYKFVFRNKAFLVLLFVFTLHLISLNFLQGIIVYYLKYIYAINDTTVIMALFLIVAIVCIPFATALSKKVGKRAVYAIGLLELAASCMVIFFFGHRLGYTALLVFVAVAGIGIGLCYATPWSMVPDAIDYGTLTSGANNEGSYYGIWTFMSKVGQAVSIGLTGLILDKAGYVAEAVQGECVIFAIRLVAGILPAVSAVFGAIFLFRYPITKEVYHDIRRKLVK